MHTLKRTDLRKYYDSGADHGGMHESKQMDDFSDDNRISGGDKRSKHGYHDSKGERKRRKQDREGGGDQHHQNFHTGFVFSGDVGDMVDFADQRPPKSSIMKRRGRRYRLQSRSGAVYPRPRARQCLSSPCTTCSASLRAS
jgi:hypothetical protein